MQTVFELPLEFSTSDGGSPGDDILGELRLLLGCTPDPCTLDFVGDPFGSGRRRRLGSQTFSVTVRIVVGATPLRLTLSESIMSNLTGLVNGIVAFNVTGVSGSVFSMPTVTNVVLARA